ncbi:MAG: hypothetical protein WCJ09_24580 [Planctomycetota bacterium]
MQLRKIFLTMAFCLLGLSMNRAHADLPTKLLTWVPADANAIIVIDAESLFKAPLATRENWRKQAADRFVNQEISIPPDARRVVMASQLDLGGGLQPVWELGILDLEKTPPFALIARREKGSLDTIAGHSAIKLPGGRSGVELDTGIVLITSQPNRQVISRWVSATKAGAAPRLSPYLSQAIEHVDRKSQVILALDLADSVTAPPIREMLTKFEPLSGKTADQADIAEILASVKGVVMSVHVTDKREGTIQIDFAKPASLLKPVAKPLMEEILATLEISLTDLEHWSAVTSENALTLKGEFSQSDLRKIVSLFAASPSTHDVHDAVPEQGTLDPQAIKAEASRKYFHSVKTLIEELRKTMDKSQRDTHLVWMERYARKIDDLPLKDVDKDLLTFGGNVSSSLRYQAQASRMAAVRGGVRAAQPVYQNYSYGAGAVGPYGTYGGYSFAGTVQVAPNKIQIGTEERANAAQVKISEMKQIEDGMVQIRRAMTERYNVEF